jgi:hypothetical protein
MVKPSYFALALSGILIGFAIIVLIMNRKSEELQGVKLVNLLLFLSTAIALHGMLHMWAEIYYNYNPLEGKLIY